MKTTTIKLQQNAQVKSYQSAYRKGLSVRHVVKHDKGWAIRKSGASRASSIHESQATAISKARKAARSERNAVVIHSADGRIRDVNRY